MRPLATTSSGASSAGATEGFDARRGAIDLRAAAGKVAGLRKISARVADSLAISGVPMDFKRN